MLRQQDKSLRPICRIDWSVFRAFSLVLFIVLAMAGGMIVHGVPIDTPEAKHTTALPGAAKEDALMVSVLRDGHVFFGRESVAPTQLSERLRLAVAHRADRHLYVFADKRARYRTIAAVVDAANANGIERVSFVTFMPRTIRDFQ